MSTKDDKRGVHLTPKMSETSKTVGHSAATGTFVLRPFPKKGGRRSAEEVRKVVKDVVSGGKG